MVKYNQEVSALHLLKRFLICSIQAKMKAKGPAHAGAAADEAALASLSDEEELEAVVAFDGGTGNLRETLGKGLS